MAKKVQVGEATLQDHEDRISALEVKKAKKRPVKKKKRK